MKSGHVEIKAESIEQIIEQGDKALDRYDALSGEGCSHEDTSDIAGELYDVLSKALGVIKAISAGDAA